MLTTMGTTVGQGNDRNDSCTGSSSPDYVLQYVTPTDGQITIDTIGSSFDTVLHVYDGCDPAALLACADGVPGGSIVPSQVSFVVDEGTPLIIFVDGWFGSSGSFTLNLTME